MLEQERQQRRKNEEATEKVKKVKVRIQVAETAEQNEGSEPALSLTRDGDDSDLRI